MNEKSATELDAESAQIIGDQIMAMAKMMGLEKEHSYVQAHVDVVKGFVSN